MNTNDVIIIIKSIIFFFLNFDKKINIENIDIKKINIAVLSPLKIKIEERIINNKKIKPLNLPPYEKIKALPIKRGNSLENILQVSASQKIKAVTCHL